MKGFILFSVLLFLHIFVLLGLYGLMAARSLLMEAKQLQQYHIHRNIATLVLYQLEKNLVSEIPTCKIPITSAAVLAGYNKEWWKAHACHGIFGKNQYDYVVEWLGRETCSLVKKYDTYQRISVEYYRISLLFLPVNLQKIKILLQSIIAKNSHESKQCSAKWQVVTLGSQMRRELVGRKLI